MLGKVFPKFLEKKWWPGIIITSLLFTGSWGYLVYTGDISTIWPLFGMSNQLLASSALIICTTMLIRTGKKKYAAVTAVPGVCMAFITMYAGYLNVVDNFLPKKLYLLVGFSIAVMTLMVVLFLATFRRWVELLQRNQPLTIPEFDTPISIDASKPLVETEDEKELVGTGSR
jgi:carbon starvation protein